MPRNKVNRRVLQHNTQWHTPHTPPKKDGFTLFDNVMRAVVVDVPLPAEAVEGAAWRLERDGTYCNVGR